MRSTHASGIDIDPALRSIGDPTLLRRTAAHQRHGEGVEVGSRVRVGLRGGGRVEGILVRRIDQGVVLRCEGAADVIVLEGASSVTKVLGTSEATQAR